MTTLALLFSLLAAAPAGAQATDDSDLSARPAGRAGALRLEAEGKRQGGRLVFRLVSEKAAGAGTGTPGTVSGRLLLAGGDGRPLPARLASATLVTASGKAGATAAVADDGYWELPLPSDALGEASVRFSLDSKLWAFEHPDHGTAYSWQSPSFRLPSAEPVRLGTLSPEPGSENAKVGLIHLTFLEALDAFARHGIATGWWRKTLTVNWPDTADYFSPWGFSLHLTTPHAWDVNLHELGHAVMNLSMRAASAGGQHKIDECYSAALAWSEGWATFFAGVVHLDPADPDARFEYLVPRRAPIRLENVPDDVCRGQTNEWRVASALWDLYDANPDGTDSSNVAFGRLWSGWAGKPMGSLVDFMGLLKPALSPAEASAARAALRQNSIEPGGPDAGSPEAPLLLAAPGFD